MTVGTPVVVSRIQNRRGTQQQFDGYVYSISGPNSVYPQGYNGIAGFGNDPLFPEFTIQNYPNVLLPGELALCTDSRRLFIGNVSGTFSEIIIGLQDTDLTRLRPETFTLVPSATWKKIEGLTLRPSSSDPIAPTPFLSFLYSVTDAPESRDPGVNFSKNGLLQITGTTTDVTLSDTSTEINTTPYTISFKAEYDTGFITVWYIHNFTSSLSFDTNAIAWLPLPII